jgi:hypothetical protein
MSFFNACSSLRASTSKLFSLAGPSALPAQTARSSSSYVNLGDLKPSKGSNQTVSCLSQESLVELTNRTLDMVEVLDLDEVELLEEVIKVKERVVGMGNLHLDSKVVRHLFIGCSQREVLSTCKSTLEPNLEKMLMNSTARDFAPLPLSRLQSFLAQARISPSEPITLHTLISSNIVHGLSNKFSGIKLLGEPDPSLPLPPLKLFLSRYSKSAAKAIMDAGGEVTAVYRNKLGLKAEKLGAVGEIKMADPTRKNDIGEFIVV